MCTLKNGVHIFLCTPLSAIYPAAAPRLACRPHKVHTLAGTFSPSFCVYISVCIQVLRCCWQNMRKSAHLYVYLKAPVLCVSLPPLFPFSFYFSLKKCTPLHMHIDYALLPAKSAKKCTPILPHFLTVFVYTFTPSFFYFSQKSAHPSQTL